MTAPAQISALAVKLKALISNNTLTIGPGTIAPAPGIDQLFTDYLGGSPLIFDQAYVGIPDGTDFVQLFGTGAGSTAYNTLALNGRVSWSDALSQYTLSLTGTSNAPNWTLANSFPVFLTDQVFDAVQIDNPSLTIASPSDAAAKESFTFQGDVAFRGPVMLPLFSLFNTVPHVTVSGAITGVDATTGFPTFTFNGDASDSVTLGLFQIKPGLTLAYGAPPAGGASQSQLYAHWTLAFGSNDLTFFTAQPFNDPTMAFTVQAGQTDQFLFGALKQLVPGLDFGGLMPIQLPMPAGFTLKTYTVVVNPADLSLQSLAVVAGTPPSTTWSIIDGISLSTLNFEFDVDSELNLGIQITATFLLDQPTSTKLTLIGRYPGFAFGGSLTSGGLDVKALVAKFSPTAALFLPSLPLTALSLFVDPTSRVYRFHTSFGTGANPWSIVVGPLSLDLDNVTLDFGSIAGNVTASAQATFTFTALPTTPFQFDIEYATQSGWTFNGSVRNVDFNQLMGFLGTYFPLLAGPNGALTILEQEFGFSGSSVILNELAIDATPAAETYTVTLDLTWKLDVGAGEPLVLTGDFVFTHTASGDTGVLTATATYKNSLGLIVTYTTSTGTLSFQWSDFMATWKKPKATFTFGDQSLGSLIDVFSNAVFPGQSFSLVSPWDLLNSIPLAGVQVVLDFSKKTATVSLGVNASFGFASLTNVGLTIDWDSTNASPPVFFIPTGTFLGASLTPANQWDVTNPASTPAVPGYGTSLVQIDFLGISQRYQPAAALDASSVESALSGLRAAFKTADGMQYSPAANWSIGFQAELFQNSIFLRALFLDEPELYGMSLYIPPPGGRFPEFSGLNVEILYKKISDALGVYQAELTLPAELRYLDFGAVSVTLPYIAVWIYTNGDFLIDLGFPYGGDFSQSFALQMLPFIGAGGFYFGVLPACSVAVVPQTQTDGSPLQGSFNPVIAFGLGVAVGLAEGLNYGIAAGGISLSVQGIIEGAFATFTAYSGAPGSGDFFWSATGKLAIVGRLFGIVNFVIVVARFDVTITIAVTFVMAAYKPALFNFSASVSVSASISISLGFFSITIGFSFTIQVSDSFTIGSGSKPPWDLKPTSRHFLAKSLSAPLIGGGTTLTFAPISASEAIDLWHIPHATAASAVVNGALQPANAQIVATLYIEQASNAKTPPPVSAFATLAQGVLLWVANAGLTGKQQSKAQALALPLDLDDASGIYQTLTAGGTPFADGHLTTFLSNYLVFTIKQRTSADSCITASIFPIPPELTLQVMNQQPIDFATFNVTTATALQAIQDELLKMQPSASTMRLPQTPADDTQFSLATFFFRDYFAMLCKGVMQAALDLLKTAAAGMTLQAISDVLQKNGDYDNLAGQATRIFLQGLRPPWPKPSSATQALYAITGQQFDASALVAGDTYTLSVIPGTKWIVLPNGKVSIDPGTAGLIKAFNNATIKPACVTTAIQSFYNIVPKHFNLAAPVKWTVDGSSSPQGIWQFPANLVRTLADNSALTPAVEIDEDLATPPQPPAPVTVDPGQYTWATAFPIEVTRIPSSTNPSQFLANTYSLSGTGAASAALLEALLVADVPPSTVPIAQIYILFPLTPGQALPSDGVKSDPLSGTNTSVTYFVLQTNLSTEGNPDTNDLVLDTTPPPATPVPPLGMTFSQMLQSIWECSVVRSGGYQLFYQATSGKTSQGLPDYLFQKNGTAEVTILVTYSYTDQKLRPFMNCIVYDQAVSGNGVLYVRAAGAPTTPQFTEPKTLQQIATGSNMTLFELAMRNRDVAIAAGSELALPRGRGMVRLDAPEPLQGIAARSGVSLAALVHANRDRIVDFTAPLTVDPMLLERGPAMNAGEIGFDAVRTFCVNGNSDDPADLLAQQFQLLEYRVTASSAFNASTDGLPVGPAQPPDVQPPIAGSYYAAVFPISELAVDPGVDSKLPGQPLPANDPYRGIGETVQIELEWHDLFGNVITTAPPSPNPYALSAEVLYFDNLIAVSAWPGVRLGYRIEQAGNVATLFVDLTNDPSRYDPSQQGAATALQIAQSDQQRFAAIYYQIARNATVTLTSTLDPNANNDVTQQLIGYVVDLYTYLTTMIDSKPFVGPPTATTLQVPLHDGTTESLFRLAVQLTIARTPSLVEPSVDDPLTVASSSVSTGIPPKLVAVGDPKSTPSTLSTLAKNIQTCFPELMPLTGTPDAIGAKPELWLMRFGTPNGYSCTFSDPNYFSLPPLSLEPLSLSNVPIASYDGKAPLSTATTVPQSFTHVDLDQIARTFLGAIDLFLSPDYAVPAWQLINAAASPPSNNPVNDVLAAKRALANAISANVLAPLASASPNGLTAARDKLQQQLLVQLAPAYQIDSIVTLAATVTGPAPNGLAPRFYGKPLGPSGATDTSYTLSSAAVPLDNAAGSSFLAFTFSTPDKAAQSLVSLDATFSLSHLQHDIAAMPPPMQAYEASSWLSFLIPFSQASSTVLAAVPGTIPSLSIPIPLDAFPVAPSLTVQSASPFPLPDGIAQARLWSYSFSYDYAAASQDDVHVLIDFTNPPPSSSSAPPAPTPFQQSMLQFSVSWPAILADLTEKVAANGDGSKAMNAMLSLAWLATNISQNWPPPSPPRTSDGDSSPSIAFTIEQEQITVDANADVFGVTLRFPATGGPTLAVPTVDIPNFTRTTLTTPPMTYGYTFGDPSNPQFLPYEQGLAIATRSISLTPSSATPAQYFDILTFQQAWGSAATRRNEFYGTLPGNTAFIYRSPYARASTPAVPLLTVSAQIDMGDSTTGNAPLATLIQNFVDALLTPAGGTMIPSILQITCAFQYTLGSDDSLTVDQPLYLTVPATVGSNDALITQLAAAIVSSLPAAATNGTMPGKLQLLFTFALFSSDPTAATLPVLKLTDVVLALDRIDFGGSR